MEKGTKAARRGGHGMSETQDLYPYLVSAFGEMSMLLYSTLVERTVVAVSLNVRRDGTILL